MATVTLDTQYQVVNLPQQLRGKEYYNYLAALWPDLYNQKVIIAPPRNGVDRRSGRMLSGWEHVQQSVQVIFETPFHERVLRRWVGSFIPHMLGESTVPRVITRYHWAIACAIDLQEPGYRIKKVHYMGNALSRWAPQTMDAAELVRLGQAIFRNEGVFYPRGHLGDFVPFERRSYGLIGRGGQFFDIVPVPGM